jgi:integrase
MPIVARELSAVEVRRLAGKSGYHAVGGVAGLMLAVQPTLSTSWVLRVRIGGKRRDMGLGSFPEISLARARERAKEDRDLIRQGINPIADRKAKRDALIAAQDGHLTFDRAAKRYLAIKTKEFANGKHAAQWESTIRTYASPIIGRKSVADLTVHDMLAVLEPIWLTKTETAKRLRGRIEAVLAWATVAGYRDGDNCARWKGNLDAVLSAPDKVRKVKHHKAVEIDNAAAVIAGIRKRDGMAARALEFLILTAARSGEIRGATWDEIDLAKAEWIIPAERMKAKREHRVPLTPDAVGILNSLPQSGEMVFPAPKGGPLSDMTLAAVHKRMGIDATVHGWRSTFKDWTAERTSTPREISEAALAHQNKDRVEAAYLRTDHFEKRRALMDQWANFLRGESNVLSMVQPC